jgi:adenylate cyclase
MVWLKQAAPSLLRGLGWGLLVVFISWAGLPESMEQWSYNLLFSFRGPKSPVAPIVIVSIGEDSFDELNMAWPWPRAVHGQLLDTLRPAKPVAVAFDIVFAEPSPYGEEDDAAFAESIAQSGKVVLAAALTTVQGPQGSKQDFNPPMKRLRAGALGYGFVSVTEDEDAFVRSAPVSRLHMEQEIPSFDLLIYRTAVQAGVSSSSFRPERQSTLLINYRGGPETFTTVPYYRILNGEVPPKEFAGKIVLVGATSPVLHDVFPTPFAPQGNMPGIEVHANMIETMLQGIPMTRIAWELVAVFMVLGVMAAVWAAKHLRPLAALGWVVLILAVFEAIAYLSFARAHVWVDVVTVPMALVLGYGTTVIENFMREQKEKRRLSRFFSPAVLTEIVRHQHDRALGASRKRVTVLFSDIRGFTTMSEKLQPEQVVEVLKDYLTELTGVVFKHGGTVDKYVGDCIMALYNVPFEDPDHAAKAVQTAVDFQKHTKIVSDRWQAKLGIDIKNGVGINTGDAVVGAMGSEQRLEYTAIGDTVNLAARLESITKEFHSPIIISETTYQDVQGKFRTRFLGEVTVKGKEIPVKIYGVLDSAEENVRHDARVELDANVTVSDGEVTVPAVLTDISVSGIAVHGVTREFETGQLVRIHLTMPVGAEGITLNAKVVWNAGEKVGFRFVDLEPSIQQTLQAIVARQKPIPERQPRGEKT